MIKLSKQKYAGKLIAFEGTDGAGKTTMINKTLEFLRELYGEEYGERVLLQKQPTDLSRKTNLFQKMMYCASHDEINYRAVQLLTLSDRVQHNSEIIIPALEAGKTVVCDRYIYTSVANMLARGYRREMWFFGAAKEIVRPNATFLAHVPPELAISRIKSRPDACDRHLNEPLLRQVNVEFLRLAKSEKFVIVDTAQNADKAFEKVKRVLGEVFK